MPSTTVPIDGRRLPRHMSDTPAHQPKLIVVVAFDPDEAGEMQPARGYTAEFQSEDRATRVARTLAQKHAAVIAWSREANPTIGEYGDPTPSRADIDMTRTVVDVAATLGIAVQDHIVIGRHGNASLKGLGLM